MSDPAKDPKFNETLKRMLAQPPKQNDELKIKNKKREPKLAPKSKPK